MLIGKASKIDNLKETELTAEELTWSCAKDMKKYTFGGDGITIVCFSSLAKGCSQAALEWYRQQDISVVFVVLGSSIDKVACMELFYQSALEVLRKRSKVLRLYCTTCSLIDISQFCKGLNDQTGTNCNTRLPVMNHYDESTLIENAENYKREELRELITECENGRDNDTILVWVFILYEEAFDVVFREYCEHITSKQGDPAVACRKYAFELLLKITNSRNLAFNQMGDDHRGQYIFSFKSLLDASCSVWFNPKPLMVYNQIIGMCTAVLNQLQVAKISFDSNQTETTDRYHHQTVVKDRLDVGRVGFVQLGNALINRIKLIRAIKLTVEALVCFWFFLAITIL